MNTTVQDETVTGSGRRKDGETCKELRLAFTGVISYKRFLGFYSSGILGHTEVGDYVGLLWHWCDRLDL